MAIRMAVVTEDPFSHTKSAFWKDKPWYPLWLVQILTIFPFTGFFGLDHMFLRSPFTAVAKGLVNMFTLGLWWIYDILQITLDRESVQKNGLTLPFFGPAGIGAGMFRKEGEEVEGKAPWLFILYTLLTLLPFGLDFFIAGDTVGGILRLMTSLIIFLWPFGFIWGSYNMYRAWITPGDVMKHGVCRPWPLTFFVEPYHMVNTVLGPDLPGEGPPICEPQGILGAIMKPVNTLADTTKSVVGLAADIALQPAKDLTAAPGEAWRATVVPLQAAVEKGLAPSVTAGLQVGQQIPKAIAAVPGIAAQVGNSIANAADPAALIAKATPKKTSFVPLPVMSGGGSSGIEGIGVGWELISDSGLLFTIGVLIIGGGVLTYLRSATIAEDKSRDDKPPKV
jgi:hypothetical protein